MSAVLDLQLVELIADGINEILNDEVFLESFAVKANLRLGDAAFDNMDIAIHQDAVEQTTVRPPRMPTLIEQTDDDLGIGALFDDHSHIESQVVLDEDLHDAILHLHEKVLHLV